MSSGNGRNGSKNGHGELELPRLPWEKQPREGMRVFAYFAYYRDLGAERSKTRAAADCKISLSRVNELASLWNWDERVEAYDLYLDRRFREQRESEVDAMNRRQAALGVAAQALATRRIQSLQESDLTAGDAARLMEVGTRVERLARGLPTEVLRGAVTISTADFQRYMSDVVGALLPFVPPEERLAALNAAEAAVERR